MTDKQFAAQFESLRAAYKRHWLVRDTQAFHEFCFAHSDRIAKLLAKAASKGVRLPPTSRPESEVGAIRHILGPEFNGR